MRPTSRYKNKNALVNNYFKKEQPIDLLPLISDKNQRKTEFIKRI